MDKGELEDLLHERLFLIPTDKAQEAVNILLDEFKQLESDVEEYKNVIDSLKQKLDVIECLYEDLKKENQALKEFILSKASQFRIIIAKL